MYNEVRGMLLEGTYHANDNFMRFQCAVYARASLMWKVIVSYRADDKVGKEAASRVLDSIEVNYQVKNI